MKNVDERSHFFTAAREHRQLSTRSTCLDEYSPMVCQSWCRPESTLRLSTLSSQQLRQIIFCFQPLTDNGTARVLVCQLRLLSLRNKEVRYGLLAIWEVHQSALAVLYPCRSSFRDRCAYIWQSSARHSALQDCGPGSKLAHTRSSYWTVKLGWLRALPKALELISRRARRGRSCGGGQLRFEQRGRGPRRRGDGEQRR